MELYDRPKIPRNRYNQVTTQESNLSEGGNTGDVIVNENLLLNWNTLTDEQKEQIYVILGKDIEKYILPVTSTGWYFGDPSGNVVASVTTSGLDAIKIGDTLAGIIRGIVTEELNKKGL